MRTYRTAISATAFTGLLVLGSSLFGATASAAPANENIDQSIVFVDVVTDGRVEVPFQDGSSKVFSTSSTSLCTGWFVSNDGHVATAGHCLEQDGGTVLDLYLNAILENEVGTGDQTAGEFAASLEVGEWDYEMEDPAVYVSQPDVVKGPLDDDPVRAQIIDEQPFENGDNALLKLSSVSDTPALAVASEVPAVGDEVTAIGYGASVSKVTDLSQQPPSHKQGSISSYSTTKSGAPVTEVDAAVTQGMSGGPTVNEDGAVIGINSFGVSGESQAFNFITDTESLIQFLDKNGVEVETASSAPSREESAAPSGEPQKVPERGVENTASEEDNSTSPFVWIGGTAVGLAVIGGIVALVVKNKKAAPPSQT